MMKAESILSKRPVLGIAVALVFPPQAIFDPSLLPTFWLTNIPFCSYFFHC